MQYKLNILKDGTHIEVYGTPKADRKGIRTGQEMWTIACHIWGSKENSKIVRYENVTSFPESSIVIKFISSNYLDNYRRAKLLVNVWKFAYKSVPVTRSFFPERKEDAKINEDYHSITIEAATLYKKYHEKNLKESKSGLSMLDKALKQEPPKNLISNKSNKKDDVEKVISKMLFDEVNVINKITDILTSNLYVDERGDLKSIGGKENANKSIRKLIKKEFLKRYKLVK